jgi:sulfate/thiosulfate transport system ATP-binding protein
MKTNFPKASGPGTPRVSIELRNISKHFGATRAVDNVSFTVKHGELIALLGPSGGGKTTVLRLIAGLESPSAGDILIESRRVNDVPVQQRNIGFVFQGYALFKTMTVFDNIAFGLRIKGWKPADQRDRVAELLKLLDIDGLGARLPHQLSGGQRQRVAIARALAPKPGVLLLDEPFGAVDARIRQELREWLAGLHEELGVTTIFVTHDQEEAMEVSHRILIFGRGRLEQVGPPREVYERPANEFVARFIGVLNVMEFKVVDGAARNHELTLPDHGIPEGGTLRIGFRPYAVRVSSNAGEHPYQATLRRVYFLGVALRIELETPTGLVVRARISKEDFNRFGLVEGCQVSFMIREYRVLAREGEPLGQDVSSVHTTPNFAEGI